MLREVIEIRDLVESVVNVINEVLFICFVVDEVYWFVKVESIDNVVCEVWCLYVEIDGFFMFGKFIEFLLERVKDCLDFMFYRYDWGYWVGVRNLFL